MKAIQRNLRWNSVPFEEQNISRYGIQYYWKCKLKDWGIDAQRLKLDIILQDYYIDSDDDMLKIIYDLHISYDNIDLLKYAAPNLSLLRDLSRPKPFASFQS